MKLKSLIGEDIRKRVKESEDINDFSSTNKVSPEEIWKELDGVEIQSLEFEGTVFVDGKEKVIFVNGKKIKPNRLQLNKLWNNYIRYELGSDINY